MRREEERKGGQRGEERRREEEWKGGQRGG